MKKFLFAIFIFLCFFLTNVKVSQAGCVDLSYLGVLCSPPQVECDVRGIWMCCTNQTDCNAEIAGPTSSVTTKINFSMLNDALTNMGFKFSGGTLGGIVSALLEYVFVFAGLALLFYLIMGGYSLMTSGGDPKKVEAGKGKVTNAILGFLIMFAAYWITQIVAKIFGLDSLGVFN